MIRYNLFVIFCLVFFVESLMGQTQKMHMQSINNTSWQEASIDNVKAYLSLPLDEKNVLAYLQQDYAYLFQNGSTLILSKQNEGPYTIHFLFQQQFHGITIYDNFLKINLEKNGEIINIVNQTSNTIDWDDELIMKNAFEDLSVFGFKEFKSESQIYVNVDGPSFARLVYVNTNDASSDIKDFSKLYLVDKNRILYEQDLHAYFAHDTIIKAYVYFPDPLTTAGVEYGGAFVNNGDSSNASLDNQRVWVTIPAMDTLDTFYLKNPFCEIKDFGSPFKAVVSQSNDSFLFNRFDDGFEDVNALFHITRMHTYINDTLGFSLVNYPLMIDAHGAGGLDNSFYSYSTSPPSIQFGEGGVDDAEDADVLVHEYGHAISFDAAPLSNTGRERRAIDEGFGDFIASSYSRAINPYHADSIYTWDGHNPYWPGRVANTNRVYNKNDSTSDYTNGGIWCSALVEIEASLGRAKANSLAIQTMYFEASNTKMPYAAQMLLKADTILYGGVDYCILVHALCNRNLLDKKYCISCDFTAVQELQSIEQGIKVWNEEGFADANAPLIISNMLEQKLEITLLSINGQKIKSFQTQDLITEITSSELMSGFYILEIKSKNLLMNTKLLKY